MKKLLFSAVCALAISGVALATVDSTQFGILKVPSSQAQTIVSVPWLASATTNAPVKIADFVLTAGLNIGDELKWYDPSTGNYQVWRLVTLMGGDGNSRGWMVGIPVGGYGDRPKVPNGLERGQAIILHRNTPIADCFYIMGKPTTDEASVALGTGGNVYSLVAPPKVTATDVNTGMTWTNIDKTDELIIPKTDGTITRYTRMKMTNGEYKWVNPNTGSADGILIPVGQGAWFRSVGTTADKRASWAN